MTESRTLPPEALDDWSAALAQRFGLTRGDIPVSLILDLARDVANGVARPRRPSARSLRAWSPAAPAGRPPTPRRPSPPWSRWPASGRTADAPCLSG